MGKLRASFLVVILCALSACSSKYKTYDGPEVTRIYVFKGERKMYLMHNEKVLKTLNVDLGFSPVGDKMVEADGKTPEGIYHIDRRNPNSAFYLSLGISYPNEQDIEEAKAVGKSPGGDIFIHGEQPKGVQRRRDWTAGCIAVKNKEMEQVYAMVRDGTAIVLLP